jgi:hypothetical protein
MSGDHNMNQKRMRTHKDKLKAMLDYLSMNIVMVHYRLNAERFHEMQDDRTSWEYLFRWADAKDDRAQLWKWFHNEYHDAVMLKEGYYETYK